MIQPLRRHVLRADNTRASARAGASTPLGAGEDRLDAFAPVAAALAEVGVSAKATALVELARRSDEKKIDDALDVVAGSDLQARIDLADYQRLVFSPDASGAGRLVDYDSPLLDQMWRLVDTMGRVAFVRGPLPSSKSVDAEHEIARAVSLRNGVYRVQGMAAIDVIDFGVVVFEYSLLADERAGGLLQVWINRATQSVPRLRSWFGTAELAADEPALAAGDTVDVPWR